MSAPQPKASRAGDRFGAVKSFIVAVILVAAVNDGWSGRPNGVRHQLLLLPISFALSYVLALGLREGQIATAPASRRLLHGALALGVLFEAVSLLGFLYEARHFARFGYSFRPLSAWVLLGAVVAALGWACWRRTVWSIFGGSVIAYSAGLLLAIRAFPLKYLRSDMLPVIIWSDRRLLGGLNPYGTMQVGGRVYDFPYLPGMLVAYVPALALHVDVRWVNLFCLVGVVSLMVLLAARQRRTEAAVLCMVWMLSPFLQYRHDLYLQPHWLALTVAVALLERQRFGWAAIAFGVSMALYQLSWVLFPFFLLYIFRRGGALRAAKEALLACLGMLAVVGPFLSSALGRIESNTVGQWSRLPHALADPMNLSYWVSYLVPPADLKWVQLAVLSGLFGYCVFAGRCASLCDTLRWMCVGLALFIALNVLVDGYFYLTLTLLLLMYSISATGIWGPAEQNGPHPSKAMAFRAV